MSRIVFAGLGANETSDVFQTTTGGDVWINVDGTLSSQTITMQRSPDNSSWNDAYPDGELASLTVLGEIRRYELGPGFFFRFVVSNGGTPDIDLYVDGAGVARFTGTE